MMANLRMSSIHAPIKLPIQNDSSADAGSDRHIDQAPLVLSCAPRCLGKGGGIGVVFHRHTHAKNPGEIGHRVIAAPRWEEIDFPDLSGKRIDRAGASNSNASQLGAVRRHGPQHLLDAADRL